jgi:hypothetical protein
LKRKPGVAASTVEFIERPIEFFDRSFDFVDGALKRKPGVAASTVEFDFDGALKIKPAGDTATCDCNGWPGGHS